MSSNLEAAITLKASVDQFVRSVQSAQTEFAGAMGEIARQAEAAGGAVDDAGVRTEDLAGGLDQTARAADAASAALERTARDADAVDEGAAQASSGLDVLQGTLTKIVAAGAGLAALGAGVAAFASEAMHADTRGRKLEAVVRATGGAAGYTADEIRKMSSELALATLGSIKGFEDAAAALLTFKTVTGDTFARSLELSQDLAEVMGGDAKSAAMQLGKALEDPERGLTALTRAGVTFTKAEQELIKALVESGRIAEAQGMILDKVAGQVGGVARAMAGGLAGSLDTVSQRWEEFKVKSGEALQPALIALADRLAGAIHGVTENMDTLVSAAAMLGKVAVAAFLVKGAPAATAYAASIGGVVTAKTLAYGATVRLAAAVGGLAGAYRGLMRAVGIGLVVAGIEGWIEFGKALFGVSERTRQLAEAQENLADTHARLAARYREISDATGVAVSGTEEFNAAVKAGQIVWDEAANAWISGAAALEKAAAAASAAAVSADELAKRDWGAQVRQAGELASALELAAAQGSKAEKSVAELVGELDLLDPATAVSIAKAMEMLEKSGSSAAKVVRDELVKALADLSATELSTLGSKIAKAFAEGKISAEEFARVNDEVLIESFRRLGLSAEDALGKVSPAARAALQSLETIRLGLAGLSADGKTKMDLLGRAITAALSRADTRAALIELRQKIVDMGQAGDIASANLASSLAKVDAKLREVEGGATNAGNAITERMKEAADALAKSREETKQLRDAMRGTADAADRAGDAAKRAGEETEKAGKKAEEVRASFAEPFLQGEAAASRFAAEAQRIGEEVFSARMAATRVATIESWSAALNTAYDLAQRKALDYIRTMEDLDRREQAINSNASRGVEDLKFRLLELEGSEKEIAAARKARDVAEVQRSIELTRLELRRAQLRGDRAEIERLEAEIRLMNEQLVLIEKIHKAEARQREGKSTKSGGGVGMSGGGGAEVPAPGVRPQVNIVVNNTIEGLLDVQDRGSLDQLGRRLAPIWADLQRRGAF